MVAPYDEAIERCITSNMVENGRQAGTAVRATVRGRRAASRRQRRSTPTQRRHGATTSVEWRTVALAVAVYLAWLASVVFVNRVGPIGLPVLTLATCWFMSLQHELIHGHPFRDARLNRLLGLLPLAVWFPYDLYRSTHIAHHRDEQLTQPGVDPESNYLTRADYERLPHWAKQLWSTQRTAAGRMLLGPAWVIGRVWLEPLRHAWRGDFTQLRAWLPHLAMLVAGFAALDQWAGIPALTYVVAVAYPALGLAMLRSFYEHRPAAEARQRVVVNEAGWLWRMLYLNNNYHAVHHEQPGLPWYRLREAYLLDRAGVLRRNGGFLVRGYMPLLARYALRAVDSPVHPSFR